MTILGPPSVISSVGGIFESRRRDPSRGVRADWPQEILKTGTLEMRFPAIWSSNFICSSDNFAGFGTIWFRSAVRNCICGEKWGKGVMPPPPAPRSSKYVRDHPEYRHFKNKQNRIFLL